MSTNDTNWMKFFEETFASIQKRLGAMLDASGCREGWLQGEFFLAGHERNLCVNHYKFGGGGRADLYCEDSPRMVAEIKIIGALDQLKMRALLKADVARLRAIAPASIERFMILVIPKRDQNTTLSNFLDAYEADGQSEDRSYVAFKTRIWQLRALDPATSE